MVYGPFESEDACDEFLRATFPDGDDYDWPSYVEVFERELTTEVSPEFAWWR
jgi:hypothetical protein